MASLAAIERASRSLETTDEPERGVVKSFNKCNGYGFLRVQGRPDDVYFKTEDLTPRSQKIAMERPRIIGVQIKCKAESYHETRVRANSVRLVDVAHGSVVSDRTTGNSAKTVSQNPSLSLPVSRHVMLDTEESLPTTRDGSDAASDDVSLCDKSLEANSEGPDEEFMVSEEQKSSDSQLADTGALPVRQLVRVLSTWSPDQNSTNQFSAQQGTLLYTWTGTATENGWIYAERLDMGSSAGWLPTTLLKCLPLGYHWRRVTKSCRSYSDMHLAGEPDDIFLVNIDSIEHGTDESWIYAECLDGTRSGWFPTCSLEELSAKLLWMHVVCSQDSQHQTHASVEKGDLLLVDPDTRTTDGWVYAWAADRYPQNSPSRAAKVGWVPAICLDWPQESSVC